MKRCFVISPIGAEGSEVRRHADEVFDFIVKPAMEECGIEALRSDHILEPGKVTDQMFRELMTDLCVAIVTGHNPNVYYELAIAQAAARPVIVLVEKGTQLPFDVQHLRSVEYDLDLRPVMEGDYKDQIVEHVRALERRNWVVEPPFGAVTTLSLEGEVGRGLRFFERATDHSSTDEWTRSVAKAERRFELLNAVPLGWTCSDAVRTLYLTKAEAGCRIRFLTLHPDNPALPMLFPAHISALNLDSARSELQTVSAFFTELANASDKIEYRQMASGIVFCEITRRDDYATYIPYLHEQQLSSLPLWEVGAQHSLYALLEQEFEHIWNAIEGQPRSAKAQTSEDGGPE